MMARLVLVLTLCYTPLSSTSLGVFNSRLINGVYYLTPDMISRRALNPKP